MSDDSNNAPPPKKNPHSTIPHHHQQKSTFQKSIITTCSTRSHTFHKIRRSAADDCAANGDTAQAFHRRSLLSLPPLLWRPEHGAFVGATRHQVSLEVGEMSCSCKAWESLITSDPSRWRRRPGAHACEVFGAVAPALQMCWSKCPAEKACPVVAVVVEVESASLDLLEEAASDLAAVVKPGVCSCSTWRTIRLRMRCRSLTLHWRARLDHGAVLEPPELRLGTSEAAEHGGASCKPGPLSTSRRASGCLS